MTEYTYTTYIKTTPEKLWNAIVNPEFRRQYWVDGIVSDWKEGSRWSSSTSEGKIALEGEVLESTPPRRLVISWADPAEALPAPEHSRVTFEIEQVEDMVRLNVIHGNLKAGSVMTGKISNGWPRVLSSLKSFLETGKALDTWAGHTSTCGTTPARGNAA